MAEANYSPKSGSAAAIREAQRRLWKLGVAMEGPDTDTLTGDYRQGHGAGVHFSDSGLQLHGRMWAEKVERYLDSVLK